mgnify:CR=1 FL=1
MFSATERWRVADAVEIGDHEALLALRVLAERDGAGDLRQRAGVLRRARQFMRAAVVKQQNFVIIGANGALR